MGKIVQACELWHSWYTFGNCVFCVLILFDWLQNFGIHVTSNSIHKVYEVLSCQASLPCEGLKRVSQICTLRMSDSDCKCALIWIDFSKIVIRRGWTLVPEVLASVWGSLIHFLSHRFIDFVKLAHLSMKSLLEILILLW
jgi:hypothetical protein